MTAVEAYLGSGRSTTSWYLGSFILLGRKIPHLTRGTSAARLARPNIVFSLGDDEEVWGNGGRKERITELLTDKFLGAATSLLFSISGYHCYYLPGRYQPERR